MDKPQLEDFGLNDSSWAGLKEKEDAFHTKMRDRESSDSHILLFWVSIICGAYGLNESNVFLFIVAVIAGIWFVSILFRKKFLDPNASPELPDNFRRYKAAIAQYNSYLEEQRQQEARLAKDREREERRQKQKTYEYWTNLDPYQFEREIAELFQKHGFDTHVTKGSGDQGIDIKLVKSGKRGIVQCKRYATKLGPSVARDLYGAMTHGRYDFGFIVCPSSFSESTFEFTKRKPITLIGLKRILEMTNESDLSFLKVR